MKLPPVKAPSKPLAERKYLTGDKVMEILGYSDAASFYQMVRAQLVPHIKVNERRYLFEESELTAWLEQRRVA